MNFFSLLFIYNFITFNVNILKNKILNSILFKIQFIKNYLLLNDLIWQEGLLLDFLQKKITDNWVKKFLIYSANLFNERLVFDKIIRFYLDLIIWPMHKIFIFEFNNVGGLLFINLFIFVLIFFFFSILYFLLLMF